MNRRTVFKHLATASAAAWLLPSCVSDPKKISVALNHLQITGDEEELLADLADVMIPATDTPGALAVKAHLFTLVMVDDCLSKGDQEKYLRGMRAFRDEVKTVTGRSFARASPEERFEMLTAFEQHQHSLAEEIQFFYNNTRAYILQGYLSSQHFLTEVKPYQLVPGPDYYGCAAVTIDSKKIS